MVSAISALIIIIKLARTIENQCSFSKKRGQDNLACYKNLFNAMALPEPDLKYVSILWLFSLIPPLYMNATSQEDMLW